MKKVLAGIAVLAVVASAQAGLLNTWELVSTSSQKNTPGDAANADKITWDNITINGKWDSASWGRMNNLANAGALTGNPGATWGFTLTDGYTFTLESIQGTLSTAKGGGVPEFEWTATGKNGAVTGKNGAMEGGVTAGEALTWTALGNAVWTADGADLSETLKLMPTSTQNINGSNVASNNRTDLKSGIEVYGTVAENGASPSGVPEPATMSLLGLGALAMVVRKLRK